MLRSALTFMILLANGKTKDSNQTTEFYEDFTTYQ